MAIKGPFASDSPKNTNFGPEIRQCHMATSNMAAIHLVVNHRHKKLRVRLINDTPF